jgi:hypothetical protein
MFKILCAAEVTFVFWQFHASINRMLAYNLPNNIGLILFGDKAT